MLRLRKVKMPDDTISYEFKAVVEDTCDETELGGMQTDLEAKFKAQLGILALNIPHCDEAKIDATGNLHTKTGVVTADAEEEGG